MSDKGKEMEERVRLIYNDCWFIYKEYLASHDMEQYNRRVSELKAKHHDNEFLRDILYGFVKILPSLHAEHLMERDGKVGWKKA